jgi:hypothetical protein
MDHQESPLEDNTVEILSNNNSDEYQQLTFLNEKISQLKNRQQQLIVGSMVIVCAYISIR